MEGGVRSIFDPKYNYLADTPTILIAASELVTTLKYSYKNSLVESIPNTKHLHSFQGLVFKAVMVRCFFEKKNSTKMDGIHSMDQLKTIDGEGRGKKKIKFHQFVESKREKLRGNVPDEWLKFESHLKGNWSRQIATFSGKLSDANKKEWREKNNEVVEFLESIGYHFKKKSE